MSTLLSCRGLTHAAGTKPLFRDITLSVNRGEKIGLNGHNGCGKSTLLKILAGEVPPDDGEISRRQGLRLGMVEQFLPDNVGALTVIDSVLARIPRAERDVEGYRAALTLSMLGFDEAQHALRVGDLSGGQLNRLMLARALVNEPDLILFDEPSNHMDLATLAWLERFLAEEIRCAFVLVSHDRALLDGVTRRTLILRDGRLHAFEAPYSAAREALTEMDIAAAAARADEEKKIAALRASAKRLAIWGQVYDNEKLARKAKSMEKRAARLEQAKTFVSRGSGLALTLDSRETRSNRMLRVADFTVTPMDAPDVPLFRINELVIRPGERLALLGLNGCGKTSLLAALMRVWRADGEDERISFSPQAAVGYYDQELAEVAGGAQETMLTFLRRSTQAPEAQLRNGLINAGFAYLDHERRLTALSGGERARLMFLALKLNRPNFLIMDEPTNHIDIDGREELEAQLAESGATLLMTSHDRRFIDNVATRFVLVSHGRLEEINDPEDFYQQALADDGRDGRPAMSHRRESASGPEVPVTGAQSGEQVLERIVELESLLAADLARKSRFQKPDLQAAWRRELEALNGRLGD
ncbi:MAG: ABC-F family ATP-binding cassette domain-containing protein [Pseudomonadales bacterium]